MFNENFSFEASSQAQSLSLPLEASTSGEISPFTSRCSSPRNGRAASPQRDSRFDTHRHNIPHRHPSVAALTAQLQSQALNDTEMRSPSLPPSEPETPTESNSDTDVDEGFYDGPETPETPIADMYEGEDDVDPTLWDLSMSDALVARSAPRPSLSLDAQALSSYTMRRRQRQALVRLQCMVTRAPDLAMLIEECHPSSLPFGDDSTGRNYNARSRQDSACNVSWLGSAEPANSGRIEKNRRDSIISVRKTVRMRKR
jgi:hypothetical protein